MANPIVQQTIDQVNATDNVIDSAVVLINGIAQMVADAVTAAIANGATAAELQPVADVSVTLKVKSDALALAIQNNTPAPPPTPLQASKGAASKKA